MHHPRATGSAGGELPSEGLRGKEAPSGELASGCCDPRAQQEAEEAANDQEQTPAGRAGIPFFLGLERKVILERAIKNRRVFASKMRKSLYMALNRRAFFALKALRKLFRAGARKPIRSL